MKGRRCVVCEEPLHEARRLHEFCSKRECRMMFAEFVSFIELRFILEGMRAYGGNGLEALHELMEQAIRALPRDEEPLACLLIEIYESQELPTGYSPW